ncbi:hypothetical protein WJX72_001817 [[Myrmecia] bisecta]|uniref:Uncharacterized protein n=1 Tax=[Myrmecia] bisecta TaxID=41462 RepID=A0AAW1PDJ4_9CHLO
MSNPLPPRRSGLRKRKTPDANSENEGGLAKLLAAAAACNKLVVFSGSGLSANSGMSTFSTPGGLYERAQAKFHVADGKKLFTYSFYEKRKLDALAFFADIYTEAKKAAAGAGHKAIADIYAQGKLVRHYTLNIDGLAEAEGMPTWHPHHNPAGVTVEMHGSIRQLVCPDCGLVIPMSPFLLKRLKRRENIPCTCCQCTSIRIRIMLYDDAEDGVITPEDLYDRMDEDVKSADMILWVGLSFEQSASTAYFRRVRHYLNEVGRLDVCRQVVINPSDESLWNLLSACSNIGSLDVVEVLASSEELQLLFHQAISMDGPTDIACLSPELLEHIFSFLEPHERRFHRLHAVCKLWCDVLIRPSGLWDDLWAMIVPSLGYCPPCSREPIDWPVLFAWLESRSPFLRTLKLGGEADHMSYTGSGDWPARAFDGCPGLQRNLTELQISGDQPILLPRNLGTISALTSLRSLQLDWLSPTATEQLNACSHMHSLTRLSMTFQPMHHMAGHPPGVPPVFPERICQLRHLEHLELIQDSWGDEYFPARVLTMIPECIGALSTLKTLRLCHPVGTSPPASMSALRQLTRLDLYGARFSGNVDWTPLSAMCHLVHLDLNNTSSEAGPLFASMGQLSNLTWLDISHNPGLDGPAFPVIPAFYQNLRILRLSSVGMRRLPEGLDHASSLQRLWLDRNPKLEIDRADVGRLLALPELLEVCLSNRILVDNDNGGVLATTQWLPCTLDSILQLNYARARQFPDSSNVARASNHTYTWTVKAGTEHTYDIDVSVESSKGDADLVITGPSSNWTSSRVGPERVFITKGELAKGTYSIAVVGFAPATDYTIVVASTTKPRKLVDAETTAFIEIINLCCKDEGSCSDQQAAIQSAGDLCSVDGNICSPDGHMEWLILEDEGLNCEFPGEQLEAFSILKRLDLTGNQVTGNISFVAHYLEDLPQLRSVTLNFNAINGSLADACDLAAMTSLQEIELRNNLLTGSIPACLAAMPGLSVLSMDNNGLSGTLPAFPANSTLTTLTLSNQGNGLQPGLTGSIPALSNTTRMLQLDLSNNGFSGALPALPASIWNAKLNGNQLLHAIPTDYGRLPLLSYLDLSNNALSGGIPDSLAASPSLQFLITRNNQLDAALPLDWSAAKNLNILMLNNNQIPGTIPPSLAALPELVVFNAGNNRFKTDLTAFAQATEAADAQRTTRIRQFMLGNNTITGDLSKSNLQELALFHHASDQPTPSLGGLQIPKILDLSNSSITGDFPEWLVTALAKAPSPVAVNLKGNNLTCPHNGFHIDVDVPHGRLNGLKCLRGGKGESSTHMALQTTQIDIIDLVSVEHPTHELSPGAVLGIIIACLSGTALLAWAIYLGMRGKWGSLRTSHCVKGTLGLFASMSCCACCRQSQSFQTFSQHGKVNNFESFDAPEAVNNWHDDGRMDEVELGSSPLKSTPPRQIHASARG